MVLSATVLQTSDPLENVSKQSNYALAYNNVGDTCMPGASRSKIGNLYQSAIVIGKVFNVDDQPTRSVLSRASAPILFTLPLAAILTAETMTLKVLQAFHS